MNERNLEDCRVLLCFENEQMSKPVQQFFNQRKVERVTFAYNNGEAAAQMNKHQFNLFIIDCDFPTLSGTEFSRFIRLCDGEMSEAPIIMYMGEPNLKKVKAAIDAGVNEILGPPFTVSSLKKYIEHVARKPRPFIRTENYIGPARLGSDDLDYL